MNLLLLSQDQLTSATHASVSGRQLKHIRETLKAQEGDKIRAGLINGLMGVAQIDSLGEHQACLSFDFTTPPPSALPLTLIIALPRPKMLRRIIQHAIALGVKRLIFINAWKVEKSYWQSPWLSNERLRENAILGLEQARDTMLPHIECHKLFKPFVEDKLPEIASDSVRLIAHPNSPAPCPVSLNEACTLIIGPEGGFTDYEVEKVSEQGFSTVHCGPRILRVETAVPALIGRLFN